MPTIATSDLESEQASQLEGGCDVRIIIQRRTLPRWSMVLQADKSKEPEPLILTWETLGRNFILDDVPRFDRADEWS